MSLIRPEDERIKEVMRLATERYVEARELPQTDRVSLPVRDVATLITCARLVLNSKPKKEIEDE